MNQTVPLSRAGTRLRRSYNQVLRLVMVGALRGGQDDEGRWWVDATDLERFIREAARPSPQAA